MLQSLPSIKKFNRDTWKNEEPYLNPKSLDVAYWIIDNYNGYQNSYNIKFITHKNAKFWLKKIKENPSIIAKIKDIDEDVANSYEYQKLILDIDINNVKYIVNNLHPKITQEYDHPDILAKVADNYNI